MEDKKWKDGNNYLNLYNVYVIRKEKRRKLK